MGCYAYFTIYSPFTVLWQINYPLKKQRVHLHKKIHVEPMNKFVKSSLSLSFILQPFQYLSS